MKRAPLTRSTCTGKREIPRWILSSGKRYSPDTDQAYRPVRWPSKYPRTGNGRREPPNSSAPVRLSGRPCAPPDREVKSVGPRSPGHAERGACRQNVIGEAGPRNRLVRLKGSGNLIPGPIEPRRAPESVRERQLAPCPPRTATSTPASSLVEKGKALAVLNVAPTWASPSRRRGRRIEITLGSRLVSKCSRSSQMWATARDSDVRFRIRRRSSVLEALTARSFSATYSVALSPAGDTTSKGPSTR